MAAFPLASPQLVASRSAPPPRVCTAGCLLSPVLLRHVIILPPRCSVDANQSFHGVRRDPPQHRKLQDWTLQAPVAWCLRLQMEVHLRSPSNPSGSLGDELIDFSTSIHWLTHKQNQMRGVMRNILMLLTQATKPRNIIMIHSSSPYAFSNSRWTNSTQLPPTNLTSQ